MISCSKAVITPTPTENVNRIDSQSIGVKIPTGVEVVPVDSRLSSTSNGIIIVPVVIINYLPTTDGIYLDTLRTLSPGVPHNSGHILTLARAKDKILNEYKILSRYIKPKNILNRNKTLEVQFYDESNSKIHRILRNDS